MPSVNVTIRMDETLKAQAEELFSDFGLNMTTAFTMFTKQALREQRIPFEISRSEPNATTIAAIEEVKAMKSNPSLSATYSDVDSMIGDLLR
ncbi:MAG: type II toxin-antitoxin system RelB/DinJ family antitoxin [Clostridia bacterium]